MSHREQGQVLPLGLVLVVFAMAGALMLFNTGQVATDKMRLANSADAAAYSGALWQARALNYQAYTNRAMVANQVAIGQAVSLHSWMTYAKVTSEHIGTALKPVPLLNVVTSGIESAVLLAEKGVLLGAQTMLAASNAATNALSVSQSVMHAATLANTPEIIAVVARETDSRFSSNSAYGIANKAANATQWLAFNEYYVKKDKAAMKERQQLIMDSRDRFTRSRNWNLFDFWVFSTPWSWHKLKRQGNTQLTAIDTPVGFEWEWTAKDTMSIHNKVIKFFGSRKRELPVSWASTFANSKNSSTPISRKACRVVSNGAWFGGSREVCSWFTADNHRAEKLANANVRSVKTRSRTLNPMQGYGGLRSFWDLSDDAKSAEDARLTVRVEVTLPTDKLNESADVTKSSQVSGQVVTAGNTLSSISAADVFYRRPKHHGIGREQREKANAYNPYWQAQLVPVSKVQRLTALALRSGGAKPTSTPSTTGNTGRLGIFQSP